VLIDILLVIIILIVFVLYSDVKKKLKNSQKDVGQDKVKKAVQANEFSLGSRLNSDYSEDVRVDALTGLPGKEAFMDRLEQTIHQSRRFEKTFAIMLLDIQELNVITEKQGQEVADKLLREVAIRLKGVVRQIDTMSRFTDDRFIFLLPQLALPETAAYVAQRLLDALVRPFRVDQKDLMVAAGIGVAVFPGDGADEAALIKSAEEALDQAKESGRNRYQFFRQELHALGRKELVMTSVFSSPDVTDHLTVIYQPHVNVATNEIINLQAMPCLNLEEIGTIKFREFARISDKCNKTNEIGLWLLKQAIDQFQQWRLKGFKPENLVIPVTLRQMENPQFIEQMTRVLTDLQFPATQLILEVIDENIFANTGSSKEQVLFVLSKLGIRIAISISVLSQFAVQRVTNLPINYLQLHSKLLKKRETEQDAEIILKMIITLVQDMKITVIAEGVENLEQRDAFQELGCEIMQGSLFGEPFTNSSN
jgi:diguanylate cyclase (GGDEF)-like protein